MPTLIDLNTFRQLREESGFRKEQADAIVDLFRGGDEEVGMVSEIDRLDERIERTKNRLLRWMLGGFGAVAGLVTLLNYVVS